MQQTYKIVYEYIQAKTIQNGFNAEDEKNLIKFLEEISG